MIPVLADWKGWKVVSALLGASIGVYVLTFAMARAAWDWDIIAYTMATMRDGSLDSSTLHARTWKLVAAYVPESVLSGFTTGAFRQRMYVDPVALQSQLPLYEIKLGYILTLKGLARLVDPIAAMIFIATASSLGVLGFLLGMTWNARGLATIAWVPLAGIFGFSHLTGSMGTPDTFVTFVYVAGVAAFLSNRMTMAVIVFVLAALIRPDCLVLNLVLSAFLCVGRVRLAGLLFVGSLLAYGIATKLSSHIGWWPQFYYNFVDAPLDLSGFIPAFSLRLYLVTLATSLKILLHTSWFYGVLGTAMLAAVLLARKRHGPAHVLLPALVIGMVARIMLYPSTELRLYWPVVFSLCLVLLAAIPKESDDATEV